MVSSKLLVNQWRSEPSSRGPLGHQLAFTKSADEPGWRLIVIFGDSGSLQHNCDERVAGDKLENPYESMEKRGFLS
jgi:hypothetical protein